MSFTILNCGTSYSRAYQNELIADFGRNMAGKEYDDFLITEGPGGSAPNAPLPGTFNPFSKAKTLKEFSPKWAQTPKVTVDIMTLEQKQVVPSGEAIGNFFIGPEKVKGQGWDDNVRHAVTVLADKFPKFDGEVNMVGFSRGAVTCLRIANWLQEFLGTQWELNIFAIDPVAGLDAGLKLQDTRRVPKIVKEYVGILAMDELRGDYKPQDLSRIQVEDRSDTTVSFLPVPGVHTSSVEPDKSMPPEVNSMVRSLAYRFLSKRGTTFTKTEQVYTNEGVCDLYAKMHKKRASYVSAGKGFTNKVQGGLHKRFLFQEASIHPFFINEHHRVAFKKAYKDIYDYFFTETVPKPPGPYATYNSAQPWGQKFEQFYRSATGSYDVLRTHFLFQRVQQLGPSIWRVAPPGEGAVPLSVAQMNGLPLVLSLIQ